MGKIETPLADLLAQTEGTCYATFRERFKVHDLAETLVAMANAHGGMIIVGIGGRTRKTIEGVANVSATCDAILEAAMTCTPPLVLPLPQAIEHGGVMLVQVAVPPGMPHVYSLYGKYLRREDDKNEPLGPNALRQLLNDRGDISWERLAPDDATFEELDEAQIAAYINRISISQYDTRAFLFRRGCLVREQNADGTMNERPTNAGLLLFGKDVSRRFPHADITLVHYDGTEPADVFERHDCCGPLPEAIRRSERWLMDHMRKGSRMVGLEREDWTQFPPGAVREALVNAVAHRDYRIRGEGIRVTLFADRLECYSPGRLPGHMTIDNIVTERFSRNETILQVLADYGLVERLGYGIDRMIHQMQAAQLPPPVFRETTAGFLVVLRGQPSDPGAVLTHGVDISTWKEQGLNDRQIAVLAYLTKNRRITNRDIQEIYSDVSAETIRRDLADLVDRNMLLKVGDRRATYYIMK